MIGDKHEVDGKTFIEVQAECQDKQCARCEVYEKGCMDGATTQKELKNLGYMNGWRQQPKEITECNAKGHRIREVNTGYQTSDHTMYCPICGYFYNYDSY